MNLVQIKIPEQISGCPTTNRRHLDGARAEFIRDEDLIHCRVRLLDSENSIIIKKTEIEFLSEVETKLIIKMADTILEVMPNGTERRIHKNDLLKVKVTVTDEDVAKGYGKIDNLS